MPKKSNRIKLTDKRKSWNKKKTKPHPYQQNRTIKQTFLIVCEGENTEPCYFRFFPLETAQVQAYGLGSSKTVLVEYVIDIIHKENDKDVNYWVVFDMDIAQNQIQKQQQDFNQAIALAESNHIQVAYSNDSFEV